MSKYRLIWSILLGGLLSYMIAGFLTFNISQKKSNEIFPIFSWFLFAEVPQKNHVRYTLRIYQADDRVLPQPLLFSESEAFTNPKSVSANKLIQDLGKAVVSQKSSEITRIRQLLEENQIHRIQRYELIKMTYDPVERFKTGKMDVESICFFERGKF